MSGTEGERAVVVTTAHRGVFFGYCANMGDEILKLRAARNCLYWTAASKGFIGLMSVGPQPGSRVSPPADIELRGITCVGLASDKAIAAWEAAPWS